MSENTWLAIIAEGQKPKAIPKKEWRYEPDWEEMQESGHYTNEIRDEYERQKSEALKKHGLVIVDDEILTEILPASTLHPLTGAPYIKGVYEINSAKWRIEKGWQVKSVNGWLNITEYGYRSENRTKRQVAIIKPIEEKPAVQDYIERTSGIGQTNNPNEPNYLMSSNLNTKGMPKAWIELWQQIEIWYGDPRKLETCEHLLNRIIPRFLSEEKAKVKQPPAKSAQDCLREAFTEKEIAMENTIYPTSTQRTYIYKAMEIYRNQ